MWYSPFGGFSMEQEPPKGGLYLVEFENFYSWPTPGWVVRHNKFYGGNYSVTDKKNFPRNVLFINLGGA